MAHNTIQTGVYSAFEHAFPAVILPLSEEKRDGLKANVKSYFNAAMTMQATESAKVKSAQKSIFTSYVKAFPVAGGFISFTALLFGTTMDGRGSSTKAGRLCVMVSLTAMAVTAAAVKFACWVNRKQASSIADHSGKLNELSAISSTLGFLKQSEKMARRCLNNDTDNLDIQYEIFNQYMNGLAGGIVPNLLSNVWADVGRLISTQQADFHVLLSQEINSIIFPMIKHYAADCRQRLLVLGYSPEVNEDR